MAKDGKSARRDLDRVQYLLNRAHFLVTRLIEREIRRNGFGEHLKPGMGTVLHALFESDGRTISQVASQARVAKSSVMNAARSIEKAGLIVFEPDENDLRLRQMRLTPWANPSENPASVSRSTLRKRFSPVFPIRNAASSSACSASSSTVSRPNRSGVPTGQLGLASPASPCQNSAA